MGASQEMASSTDKPFGLYIENNQSIYLLFMLTGTSSALHFCICCQRTSASFY